MIEPDGGRFTYSYLDDGLIRHLENPWNERTTWSYDSAGQTLVQRLANGTRASYAYDDAGPMLRLANLNSDGTTISSFRDTWDAVGNCNSRVEADGVRVTWSYDATYQLTRERRSGTHSYDVTYSYDASQNRWLKLEGGVRTTYTCDAANQLLAFQDNTGVTTLTWDANGNQRTEQVPAGGISTSIWAFDNRLTNVILPTGLRTTFSYNGDGVRVRHVNSSETLKAIWDGGTIVAESNASDVIQVVYSLSPGRYGDLVSLRRSSNTAYFHFDPLGSTDRLSDGAQSVTDSYLYKAFGTIAYSTGTTTNGFRYVGCRLYYFHGELEQCFVRVRFLHTRVGRWTSRDPLRVINITERIGPYQYAENRPLVAIDPSGELSILALDEDLHVECGGTPYIHYAYRVDHVDPMTRNPGAPCDGWLVQAVTVRCAACKCGKEIESPQATTYWEAWPVAKGQEYIGPGRSPQLTDRAEFVVQDGSKGAYNQLAEVRFYCSKKADDPRSPDEAVGVGDLTQWSNRKRRPKFFLKGFCKTTPGTLRYTGTEPAFWVDDPVDGPTERFFGVEWYCCESRDRNKQVTASGRPIREDGWFSGSLDEVGGDPQE